MTRTISLFRIARHKDRRFSLVQRWPDFCLLGCLYAAQVTSLYGAGLEDIRSSQNTVLETPRGELVKVQLGVKVFSDADDVLIELPEELLGRRFVFASKNGVEGICRRGGYVYAITASKGAQVKRLEANGFKQLDLPEFQIFKNGSDQAVVYQKAVAEGERLELGSWTLLVFGPNERGGVPYSKMRSLESRAFLPDGSEFKTWEVALEFSKTYYVDQGNAGASDSNPGTKSQPFKTINQAARVLQPGERVVVSAGVYREWICPLRGGTDPEHMISYEAAPGAKVTIKGSEILKTKWTKSKPWIQDNRTVRSDPSVKDIWMARLPSELFVGYNPFAIANYRQVDQMIYWNLPEVFSDRRAKTYLQVRGLLFQNGKLLKQVSRYTELYTTEGAFWAETSGLTIHVSPYGGVDPDQAEWETTTREQIFAPEVYNLGYIRLKGFVMQNVGNSFPFPQRGAISTMMGHHWIIEGNTLSWVNGVGIDIGDQGEPPSRRPEVVGYHILRRNTLTDIGITGITGPGPYDTLIEDNVFRRNAWHDVEFLAECGAIKTHHNVNVLIRRNLVLDTLHGAGIYIDSVNSNSRICQNVVVQTGSNYPLVRGLGGIYVEAAAAPNLVDHNVVWGSTYANGIYDYTTSKVTVAHNLVGNCAGAGIMILDVPGRGTIPVGNNRVVNNILVNNGWHIEFYSPNNLSDGNLFGRALQRNPFHFNVTVANPLNARGKDEELKLQEWRNAYGFDTHSAEIHIEAELNPDTLELVWEAQGEFAEGSPVEGLSYDFWNRARTGKTVLPGPFGTIPKRTTRISIDPRIPANP